MEKNRDITMVTVIIQHEVREFTEWKKFFDADEPGRTKAGVKLKGLYTSVKNPNDVTMVFTAPDAEVFGTMMSDPERQKTLKKAGVISAPVASILNEVQGSAS